MELNVQERILTLSLTREVQGRLTTLRIVRDLQGELSFSEEEIKKLKIEHPAGGGVSWDHTAETPKDVKIGEVALDIILRELQKLDEADPPRLTMEFVPIYERYLKEKADQMPKLAAV